MTPGPRAAADANRPEMSQIGEGELVGSQIECPRHGARFDVKTGKALCLPAVIGIPTYEVDVRGEEIFIKCSLAKVST